MEREITMRTVVIVDDEPITRMDLSDMLYELGFDIVGEASDGFDAIELCREKNPDIVFMDVKMPIFDGLSAAKTIIEEDVAGCVILLTAFSDTDIIQRASELGVTAYLTKPIVQKMLLPTIEVAYAQSIRLKKSKNKANELEKRLEDNKLIQRAQIYLARTQGCSESEAYQQMRRSAMDKRLSLAALAERILSQETKNRDIAVVKEYLMTKKGMKENRAYQYILTYGKNNNCSIEEAARMLKRHFLLEI